MAVKVGVSFTGTEIEIYCPAFRIKAQRDRNRFEKSRFAATVFADEIGYFWMEF